MTQYRQTKPRDTTTKTTNAEVHEIPSRSVRTLADLKNKVDDQAAEIETLKRTVRKLQNELRVAVNTFNLKTRG